MEHIELAMQGKSFELLAEDQIRRRLPKSLTVNLKLPFAGKGSTDMQLTLLLFPHRVGVAIKDNSDVHLKAEIVFNLKEISHSLLMNDLLSARHLITGT